MAFISEIKFRGSNNSGNEFVEVTLAPGENPANFVVSGYDEDGNLHPVPGIPTGEVTLSSLSGSPHPDNPAFTVYTIPLGIRNADADSNEASGVALTNTSTSEVVDFYSADNLPSIDPQQGAADLPGVSSENILEHTVISSSESYQWDINGNLSLGTADAGDSTICFHADTFIETGNGAVPCHALRVGDHVRTLDRGLQPIQWVGHSAHSRLELQRNIALRAVIIRRDALGPGIPNRDLRVSRQHRILVRALVAKRMYGSAEVLVAAHRLTALPGIEFDTSCDPLTYVHLLLDEHEIVCANGTHAESLLLAEQSDQFLDLALFSDPDGRAFPAALWPLSRVPARVIASGRKAKWLTTRLARNRKSAQAHLSMCA